jgi:hypothetical protein
VAPDRKQYSGVHTRHGIGACRTQAILVKRRAVIMVVTQGRDNWTRATRKWCVLDTERDSDLVYICNRTDIY